MISRKVIGILAYRNTSPSKISIFKGGPVRFAVTLDSSINLEGCSSLRLDLRISATDEESALASSSITSPSGSSFEFDFSTGETNQPYETIWLVLSAVFPGSSPSEDNLDPLFISEVTVVPHNASVLAPAAPNSAIVPTEAFTTVNVVGQSGISAGSTTGSFTIAAGSGIIIETNSQTNTITIRLA